MQNKKKNTAKNILLTGTLIAGSVIGLGSLNANTLETFKYHELGSGGELRSELLNNFSSDVIALELDCGEDTKKSADTKKAKDKNADAKSTDQKCGEGKCGEGKAAVKTDKAADPKAAGVATEKTKDSKATESKSKEAKCGEGKCGD